MKGKVFGALGFIVMGVAFTTLPAVADPPRIVRFVPDVRYVAEHKPYWLSVAAFGNHRLQYHWWHQEPDSAVGHEIPNEYGVIIGRPRLTVYNALPNRDYNGWYWCVVVDSVTGEETTSPRGQVVVVTAPTITQQPTDQTVATGGTATFTTEADAGAPVPISYQWFFNDKPLLYAGRQQTLTLANVTSRRAGYYSCRVRTMGGFTWTGGALLTVQ